LESIKLQTWANTEIIVVDNSSTDNTQVIAQEFTDKVFTKGPERSAQRNFGMIDKSEGEYVIYIDADMIVSPSLIESCVVHARRTGAVALHISEIVLGRNYFSRVRRFERGFYDGTPVDGARFFHRHSFMQVGGFDERLFEKGSGEDWDIDKLMKQIGRVELLDLRQAKHLNVNWTMCPFIEQRGVAYDPAFHGIYHNESEFRLLPYLKKKSYYSLGFDGYIEKWGKEDPDIRRQFSVVYRFWTIFTENGKWRRLLMRPDLTLGMYFLRFCVGLVYFLKKIGVARTALPSR
jgi:glycosyltransferase involved in cell wall biosynthesis